MDKVQPAPNRVFASLVIGLLVISSSKSPRARAQSPTLQIRPAVSEIVVVDAYVTDSKGRSITDLQKEDFELREDSRPVEIAAFQGPSVGGPPPDSGGLTTPPPPARNTARVADEPRTVVIYVDRALLSPAGRKRALDQAAQLADAHIARGARVVVIAEDKGLRPLTALTTDPAVVREALTRIQRWATESPGATEARSVLDNIRSRIDIAEASRECDVPPACVCVMPSLITIVRGYATFRGIEVQQAGERLSFLINALRGIAGAKELIYVSEGLEQRPGLHLYDQLTTICPESLRKDSTAISSAMQEIDASAVLRDTVARANAARVTFYPLDARGLAGLSSADIESSDRRYVASARTDSAKDANLVNQYRYLAEQTGGFAMIRGLDPAASMKRFDAGAQGHYVLGFVPGDPDGRTHALFVGLTDKAQDKRRAEIRYRQSYLRAPLPARRGQRALSALLFGLEENTLRITANVERTGAAMARVRIALPLSSLQAIGGVAPAEGRVQVVLSFRATDAAAGDVTVREKEVTYALTEVELARDEGRREIVVEVPIGVGGYEFAIGVEDVASGAASYVRRALKSSP